MNIGESITQAFDSVRMNKLRTFLTLLSISIGVFAIIGAGSLVDSINSSVFSEMEALGRNSFFIYRVPVLEMGHSWRKYAKRKPITYTVLKELKKELTLVDFVTAHGFSMANTIEYGENETDPDVNLMGVDENFFAAQNVGITKGRPFTAEDIDFNRNFAVIGNDIVVKLFPNIDPIGKRIKIKNHSYTVIGVLETKGAVLGEPQDNRVIIPLTEFLRYYASMWEYDLFITIKAVDYESLDDAIDEAIGTMRSVRNLKPWQENDFEVETNESLTEQFASFTGFLSYFGAFSGLIALIAAGVGIMNIMLVSVKERTREIGIRKAVGAKRRWILYQFIIEAITLCQIGGFIGIVMGLVASAFFGSLMNINLILPYSWVIFSIVICTLLGIIFGAYPAWKAAKLDPIDALRYE
ncbi:MAG: FtsX-like permease family protein [Bacteroidetes bacterium]|nr:MAG: FtsX-like permease family protein [Bacteroidota bacterium]